MRCCKKRRRAPGARTTAPMSVTCERSGPLHSRAPEKCSAKPAHTSYVQTEAMGSMTASRALNAHSTAPPHQTRRVFSRPQAWFTPCTRTRCRHSQSATRRKRLRVSAILLSPPSTESASASSVDIPKDLLVPTHFTWLGGGSVVEIWGSWNNWDRAVRMHCPNPGQPHYAIISLPLGGVEYKYKVDGSWRISLKEETVASDTGTLNNFRVVHPTLEFFIDAPEVQRAAVVGDWDNWLYSLPLEKDPNTGQWVGCTHLKPGQYSYQYILDQRIAHNTAEEAGVYPGRGVVNMAWAIDQPMFRIFYCTGWDMVHFNYRRILANGMPETRDFQQMRMVSASSRGNHLGQWFTGTVVPLSENEQMEFFLTNGKTGGEMKEDRPGGSKNGNQNSGNQGLYLMPRPGSYKLTWGNIRPFPRGAEPRYMLVSDIDGTMIGEHGDAAQYASSRRFRDYWESGPALSGSILVFNTGRSVGAVKELLKTVPDVATPDAIIAAVGTKVFLNMEEVGRAKTSGLNWVEDMEWTRQLDRGWNLDRVRRHARRLMDQYNGTGQLNVLDDGSEHQHRFSFSADVSIVDHVKRYMQEECAKDNLEVKIIVSGAGGHRYVDCVSISAGKEKALQFLRDKYAIPEHYVVAAGDSGNDILMLEGDHPAIVVGNAQAELLAWLIKQPQNGKVILTDAFYADGIMEGLARHGLF